MRWKDMFSEKGNRRLLLGSIIMIIVMMVMIRQMNKNHFSELQETITSIYENRLLAKDYIFELSKKIYSKKIIAQFENEFLEQSIQMNDSIQQLIKSYENTELTKDEELLLVTLKDNIRMSEQYENKFLHNPEPPQREIIADGLTKKYDLILSDLGKLSEIQLSEGKKLLDNSYVIVGSSNNTSHLEIAMTIVFLLLVIKIIKDEKTQPEDKSQFPVRNFEQAN